MDPLPSDPVPASGPSGDADKEARIEQLLLSGLEHYFAGQYERAISVWTRVVFLERQHDRARAYIERARSALAERERESEELLGSGIAAYNAGDVDTARHLLTQAADNGSDTAHVFLDRLSRMSAPATTVEAPAESRPRQPKVLLPRTPVWRRRTGWIAAAALAVVVAGAMLLGGLPIGTWLSEWAAGRQELAADAPTPDPLPIVRSAEMALIRARSLHESGRLHDALRTLDRIDIADPLRTDADRLRAQVQSDLLSAAGLSPALPVEPGGPP